jgi:hypothetical protein
MVERLNKNPELSELIPLTYSMLINNIDISKQKKVKSEYSFLNLENLVLNFPLDKNFISKSYYQSIPEFAFNDPPKGPIDKYFECMFCNQSGPNFHLKTCTRPFESSLYLTSEGTKVYKDHEEGTPYSLIVVKRGQKKVISKSIKTDKFSDSVEVLYSDINERNTIIRISKNGTINIISAGFGNKKLPNEIIDKINKSSGALNINNYSEIYPKNDGIFKIDPKLTYKYLLFAQFNLYPKEFQENFYINLNALNINLWGQGSIFKKVIGKKETILTLESRELFYYIYKYELNLGDKQSKSNKLTNPTIIFNMIPSTNTSIKVNITIYKRGSVQLRASYIDSKDVSKVDNPLSIEILEEAYSFLEELLTKLIMNSSMPIIVSEVQLVKKGIHNMVDGKQPKVCADRKGLRPVPYSFYGTCPSPDMYVRPQGKARGDGTYEPCCYSLKGKNSQDSLERYENILLNGYPDERSEFFNENIPNPDNKSAVFIPGTNIVESRRFKGLNNMENSELLKCIEDFGYIRKKTKFDEYFSFKENVLTEYSNLIGFKKIPVQGSIAMTISTSKKLTENPYILTPINDETLNVILYFNELGESFFINLNKDVSESSLPAINELKNTIIEGYLYPYPEEFIFYPIDILYLSGKNVMEYPFLNKIKNKEARYNLLMYGINIINKYNILQIEIDSRFDLDIVRGANNYLTNRELFGDISGLLFIPTDSPYFPKNINKKLLLWSDTHKDSNLMIVLNVYYKSGNIWEVKIDSKNIPLNLLPQDIELPLKFVNKNNVVSGDLIMFEINLNVNGTINIKKPLNAIQKLDEKTNDYSDVINILQSIQTPLNRNVFTKLKLIDGKPGFEIDNKFYYMESLNSPLNVLSI